MRSGSACRAARRAAAGVFPVTAPAGWFSVERVAPGVTRLSEPFLHRFVRANLWLVEGREADLLVDTGCGVVPLAPVVAGLRADPAKPLLVVATHVHVDHAGGLHEFAERLGHAAEAAAFATMDDADTVAGYLRSSALEPGAPTGVPPLGATRMRPAPLTRVLAEDDRIELGGGRSFRVLHLPGHSPGCLSLFDESDGTFVAGDVVYEGEIVDDLAHSDVAAYCDSMRRVMALPVARAFCGHGPVLDGPRARAAAEAYLASRNG